MTKIKNLFAFFMKRVLPAIVPPPPPPLNEEQVAEALMLFRKHIHFTTSELFRMLGGVKSVPRVQCPVRFGGCGYVEGRTKGAIVDSRITIVEADDDMGFTEVCVLIDNLPCLLVQEGYYANVGKSGLSITVITERDYLDHVLNPSLSWASTYEEFIKLPSPIQAVMRTILDKLYDYHYNRVTGRSWKETDAVEKVLNYGMSR